MKPTDKKLRDMVIQRLIYAKNIEDLEAANDLADEAVIAGVMTKEEVDALWEDLEACEY